MKYMLVPMMDEAWWDGLSDDEQKTRMARYGEYAGALHKSGALLGAYRPEPSSAARTVTCAAGRREVQEGPHAATREQAGGFYLIEAPDLDAAIDWAERCPASEYGVVEVRPIRAR